MARQVRLKRVAICAIVWCIAFVEIAFFSVSQAQAPNAKMPIERLAYDDVSLAGTLFTFFSTLEKASNPFHEFDDVAVPSVDWILAKAQCETGMDWKDRGTYGGAFGFMHRGYETDESGLPNNSTWGRWGGFRFGKHPWDAEPIEQVVVYIRINWAGWHRPNGMFRPPSSSLDTDNLCYQYANDTVGELQVQTRDMQMFYVELREKAGL